MPETLKSFEEWLGAESLSRENKSAAITTVVYWAERAWNAALASLPPQAASGSETDRLIAGLKKGELWAVNLAAELIPMQEAGIAAARQVISRLQAYNDALRARLATRPAFHEKETELCASFSGGHCTQREPCAACDAVNKAAEAERRATPAAQTAVGEGELPERPKLVSYPAHGSGLIAFFDVDDTERYISEVGEIVHRAIAQRDEYRSREGACFEELCDIRAQRDAAREQLRAMTKDRNLWQEAHNEDCPNIARAEAAEARLAALAAGKPDIPNPKE